MKESTTSDLNVLYQNFGEPVAEQSHRGKRYEFQVFDAFLHDKKVRSDAESFCNNILNRPELEADQRYFCFSEGKGYSVCTKSGNSQNNRKNYVITVYRADRYELTEPDKRAAIGFASRLLDILLRPNGERTLTLHPDAVETCTKCLYQIASYLDDPMISGIPVLIRVSTKKTQENMSVCKDPDWIRTVLALTEPKKNKLSVNAYSEILTQSQSLMNISLNDLLYNKTDKELKDLHRVFCEGDRFNGIRASAVIDLAAYLRGQSDYLETLPKLDEETCLSLLNLLRKANQVCDRAAKILLEAERLIPPEAKKHVCDQYETLFSERLTTFDSLNELIVYAQLLDEDPLHALTNKLRQMPDKQRKDVLYNLLPSQNSLRAHLVQWRFLYMGVYPNIGKAMRGKQSDLHKMDEYYLLFCLCQFNISMTGSKIRLNRLSEEHQNQLALTAKEAFESMEQPCRNQRWIGRYKLFRDVYHNYISNKRLEFLNEIRHAGYMLLHNLWQLARTF